MVIDHKEVIVKGKFLKVIKLLDEWYIDLNDPNSFVDHIKNSNIKGDIFTFMQRFPHVNPRFNYHLVWDNIAAIPLSSYDFWIEKQITRTSRKCALKALKTGVIVKLVEFNDELIKGIKAIYDETPIRQGRPFWHYQKDLDYVKNENNAFLEKCNFIGAFYNGELIGYIKQFYENQVCTLMQILSKIKHRDKSPTNALIAKSVEICCARGITHLLYGNYSYGNKNESGLLEFKKHNGFEKIDIPRYFIPLTLKGKIGLKLNLQAGLNGVLPGEILNILLEFRKKWYQIKYRENI